MPCRLLLLPGFVWPFFVFDNNTKPIVQRNDNAALSARGGNRIGFRPDGLTTPPITSAVAAGRQIVSAWVTATRRTVALWGPTHTRSMVAVQRCDPERVFEGTRRS